MTSREKKPLPSLNAFVEQTAKMLRDVVSSPLKKKRKVTKEDGLTISNKVHQIAKLLREAAAKKSSRKKRNH